MTVAVVGLAAGSVISEMVLDRIGFPVTALNIFTMSATVVGIAGLTHTIYKLLYTEAEQGINIRPDGVTRFGYFKSKLGKERLEGEGTILWPNGIGYEGLFENDLIKNNPNGKLILFPEENEYNVEFSNTRIPEKENEKHTFTNVHYFKNTSYNRVNKLLRFADGDVFRGIPNENTEGIYIPMNGTVVRATLRDVLLRKKVDEKKALATKIDSDEPICEGTVDCGDPDHPGNVD
jgi:hypothetical protein